MLLLPNDLPSGGAYAISPPIKLKPLTFLEILEYSNEVSGSKVKDYLRDISWLRKMDPGILQHSLYDLDYIIFMMKVHTISDDKEFQTDVKCDSCNHRNRIHFTLGDFKFIEVESTKDLISRVLLGGYKYKVKIPTVEQFLNVLNKYSLYKKTDNVEVIKLISLFPEFETMPNDVENAVLNASRQDIGILYLLETKYLSSTESIKKVCSNCNNERGMAIGISSLIADMFRDVLFNNPIDESQVQLE